MGLDASRDGGAARILPLRSLRLFLRRVGAASRGACRHDTGAAFRSFPMAFMGCGRGRACRVPLPGAGNLVVLPLDRPGLAALVSLCIQRVPETGNCPGTGGVRRMTTRGFSNGSFWDIRLWPTRQKGTYVLSVIV